MFNSVRPHRWQPTRLPRPWDSPGMNTGVGCHFLLQCMKVKSESEVAQSCPTLAIPWTAASQAPPSMGFSRQENWSGVPLPSLIFMSTIFKFTFCSPLCYFSSLDEEFTFFSSNVHSFSIKYLVINLPITYLSVYLFLSWNSSKCRWDFLSF